MTAITTHVLDVALGRPAAGVPVALQRVEAPGATEPGATEPGATEPGATEIGRASTDDDGRVRHLGPAEIRPGTYRLVFDTAAYFLARHPGDRPFFPEVTITFTVHDQARDYHVPLLLSPYGYSTYRGS
jgi:5-hydroxyisourate hydrolase